MKKLILLFIVYICSLGNAYAQFQELRADPIEKIAKRNILHSLKSIEDLTEVQINKLVIIELKIDKELPFLTTVLLDNKKWIERLEKIMIMREILYKDVLTPKQMEEFSRLQKKSKELLDSKTKR
ncbi:MAG: hypothetical protein AB9922_05455 [Bacteroidales bacterium]